MTESPSANVLRAQAVAAMQARRWAEAREQYERLCAAGAGAAADWCALGTIHGMQGDMARAEACFGAALGCDPGNAEAHCNLGVVYESRGETEAAISCYRATLARSPGRPEAVRNLAAILCESGRLDEAQSAVAQLYAAPEPWPTEAAVLQGRIHERRGDHGAAVSEYKVALAREPGHFEARLWLANLLLSLWRCEEALPHYRELARAQPRNASIHNNLAVTLARLGRLTAAERACEQAFAADPRHAGARENQEKIRQQLAAYEQWNRTFHTLTERDRALIRERITGFVRRPVVSLLLPARDGDDRRLMRVLDAVQGQLYRDWELCVVLDESETTALALVKERARRDSRIHPLAVPAGSPRSEVANAALAVATGEYVALLGEHDEITEHALYLLAEEINRAPEAAVIYGDEDRMDDDGRRFDPWFRPEWNPDLLLSQNYIGTFACCRTAEVRRAGGFDRCWEGFQEWNLLLQLTAAAEASAIRHVPFVLYHRRVDAEGDEPGAMAADPALAAAMLAAHLSRLGRRARVTPTPVPAWRVSYPVPDPAPLVTIIIPTRDRRDLLEPCVRSIFEKTLYPRYEVLIVDNQSADPEALAYLKAAAADPRVRVLPYDAPFNYSAICNRAVEAARGEVVVLLNNDTEVISPDWLDELVGHAARPEVGIVGAMLYYPDDTIQHGGVACMPPGQGGVHHLQGNYPRGYRDSRARARASAGLTAVTGACQAMRKAVYMKLGGMDQDHLLIHCNDIELCLKSWVNGFRVVWTPWAELYHRESASTGDRGKKREDRTVLEAEYRWLRGRLAAILDTDPAMGLNVSLGKDSHGLAWPPRVHRPWLDQPRYRD